MTCDNELQSLRISLDIIRSKADLDVFSRCQTRLVDSGILNAKQRVSGSMPSKTDENNMGYMRPELAVLGAYVKMSVFEALLKSDLCIIM